MSARPLSAEKPPGLIRLAWARVLAIASAPASLFVSVSEKAMRLQSKRKELVTIAAKFLFAAKASGLVSEMPRLSLA
jgi:hypothetical protein